MRAPKSCSFANSHTPPYTPNGGDATPSHLTPAGGTQSARVRVRKGPMPASRRTSLTNAISMSCQCGSKWQISNGKCGVVLAFAIDAGRSVVAVRKRLSRAAAAYRHAIIGGRTRPMSGNVVATGVRPSGRSGQTDPTPRLQLELRHDCLQRACHVHQRLRRPGDLRDMRGHFFSCGAHLFGCGTQSACSRKGAALDSSLTRTRAM